MGGEIQEMSRLRANQANQMMYLNKYHFLQLQSQNKILFKVEPAVELSTIFTALSSSIPTQSP